MSIDLMKKDDLLKEVRRLTQELKLKDAEIDSLLRLSEEAQKATEMSNKESNDVLSMLPYLAVSIVKRSSNQHRVIQVRFDLDGNAKVDFSKEKVEKEGYRAGYEAAKLMETIVAIQEEPKEIEVEVENGN